MKIFTLIHEYPPIGTGGGIVAELIADELRQLGIEIKVLAPNLADRSLPAFEDRNGVEVHRVPSPRKSKHRASFIDMLVYLWNGFFASFRLLKKWKPDILHVHFAVPAGALAWALHKLYKIPYVITTHLGDVPGGAPEKTRGWFLFISPFTHTIWQNASKRVAVSQFTQKLASKTYKLEVDLIPNGIKLIEKPALSLTLHRTPGIVFAGRLVKQKNPMLFLRVLNKIKDLDWTCQMLGDGPMRLDIQAEIKRLGLQDRIQLTGWLSTEEVFKTFEKNDILFMPSRSEGMPMVGIQALAGGLAIVGSEGFSDLVDENLNGRVCAWDDEKAFELALRNLLENPPKLLEAKKQSLRLSTKFKIETIAQSYKTLFDKLIENAMD